MQIYLVGGAVRDTLLGLPVKDRDWVVVGATPQQLLDQGFTPVGSDFPVFLHPRTHEEYALARTERKTAPGYQGFAIHAAPDVTLEDDLARRDLRINAIAVDAAQLDAQGRFDPAQVQLCDPFQGQQDIRDRVLRHATDAFREDPVRILRVARFAARYADFSVADETLALMRVMVAQGEAGALVAERVWQEIARGLMEPSPSRMFTVLQACGAHQVVLPELTQEDGGPGTHVLRMLDQCAALQAPLDVRFACLCLYARALEAPTGARDRQPIRRLCARLRINADCSSMAELAARERTELQHSAALQSDALVRLLERCDALRKPARFGGLLLAMECDARAQGHPCEQAYAPRQHLLAVLAAAQSVSAGVVATHAQAQGSLGSQIGEMVHAARVRAVAALPH
jgi:tRNA nucleotidyltransferase (CCA-adding enzyme)